MEIGVLYLLLTAIIVGPILAYTKIGKKYMKWSFKKMGINLDEYPEE